MGLLQNDTNAKQLGLLTCDEDLQSQALQVDFGLYPTRWEEVHLKLNGYETMIKPASNHHPHTGTF